MHLREAEAVSTASHCSTCSLLCWNGCRDAIATLLRHLKADGGRREDAWPSKAGPLSSVVTTWHVATGMPIKARHLQAAIDFRLGIGSLDICMAAAEVLHLPPAPVTAEDLAGSSNCGLRLDVTCSRSPRQRKKEGCLTPDAEGLQSRC